MTRSAIRAVTFDLWDTVFLDDSDEPKRAAAGLLSKPDERRKLVQEFLSRHEPISSEQVDAAYDKTDAAFRRAWYGQDVTWTVAQRLSVLLKTLGRELPGNEMAELVRLHEDMELTVRPELVPGIREALVEIHGKYKLGVISDAIFSPGRALRQLLEGQRLLGFFEVLIFSDEIGCCKPDPRVFHAAAKGLGVEICEIVHYGDREEKDIQGPAALGARSILCTAARRRGSKDTRADAICDDHCELPAILEALERT